MEKESIETWYQQECRKAGNGDSKEIPFHQKWVAFTLLLGVPVGLSGCAADPESRPQPVFTKSVSTPSVSTSTSAPLTAFDECEWERETYGLEIDCDNNDSEWYESHGYMTKHSYVHTSSPFYRSRRSSQATTPSTGSKGVPVTKPQPTPTTVPKPSSPAIVTQSAKTAPSSLSSPTSTRAGGIGSGGTSSGGFSSGG